MGSKLGYRTNVVTTGFNTLSNVSTVEPTGEQTTVVSSSVDDSVSGTGAQKVKITYLNTSWQLNEEIVSMNGTTTVNTVATNISAIERFDVFQVGSNNFNVGNITLKSTDGTRLFAQINSGDNTFARLLHYVLPSTKTAMQFLNLSCPTSSGVVFILMIMKDNIGGGKVLIPVTADILINSTIAIDLSKADLECDATQSSQALQFGIWVKGLAANQTASATLVYYP